MNDTNTLENIDNYIKAIKRVVNAIGNLSAQYKNDDFSPDDIFDQTDCPISKSFDEAVCDAHTWLWKAQLSREKYLEDPRI